MPHHYPSHYHHVDFYSFQRKRQGVAKVGSLSWKAVEALVNWTRNSKSQCLAYSMLHGCNKAGL